MSACGVTRCNPAFPFTCTRPLSPTDSVAAGRTLRRGKEDDRPYVSILHKIDVVFLAISSNCLSKTNRTYSETGLPVGMTENADENHCRSCEVMKTCDECLAAFTCGWCGNDDNPRNGVCVNGDFSGEKGICLGFFLGFLLSFFPSFCFGLLSLSFILLFFFPSCLLSISFFLLSFLFIPFFSFVLF